MDCNITFQTKNNNKKNKSIIFDENLIERVEKTITPNCGIETNFSLKITDILENYLELIKYSTYEVYNKFTFNECCALCDLNNGMLFSANMNPKQTLLICFEDACTYEELDTTWKIDKEQMIEKIKQLTVMQVYAIFSLCNKFLIIANKGDAEESKIIYELFKPVEPTE